MGATPSRVRIPLPPPADRFGHDVLPPFDLAAGSSPGFRLDCAGAYSCLFNAFRVTAREPDEPIRLEGQMERAVLLSTTGKAANDVG
jgi:hypothetical protein